MSIPLISVSFCTIRSGWLGNTFRALGQQTMDHDLFEFVVVDDYGDRWSEIEALAEEHHVNVKYLASKPYHWRSNRQLGNARNTGFIHCDGELVVFLDDYSWVEPNFLSTHWSLYKHMDRAIIGAVQAVEPNYGAVTRKDDLTPVEGSMDERLKSVQPQWVKDKCPPGWFWTFNASASLRSIVRVNGYDEEFDCTGEDDIDLGQRMARVGQQYLYTADPRIVVYHMKHNGGQSRAAPFKPEECHRVTKELYDTRYDGSWGLLERNKRREPWKVNEGYFSLKKARKNRDKYPVKEWKL